MCEKGAVYLSFEGHFLLVHSVARYIVLVAVISAIFY